MGLNFLTHKMQIIIETFFYSTSIYLLIIHSVLGALSYNHWGLSEKMQNGRFISPLSVFFLNLFLAAACRILVHQPGIESALPAVEAPSLTHWTARKVLPHSLNPLHLFIRDSGFFLVLFFNTLMNVMKQNSHKILRSISRNSETFWSCILPCYIKNCCKGTWWTWSRTRHLPKQQGRGYHFYRQPK